MLATQDHLKVQGIANKINTSKVDYSCKPCQSIDELLLLKPEYIVETASPSAFKELALPALKNRTSIVTLSIGALADADFYEVVKQTALENDTRVHIASGAIGGLDVLKTVSLMEESKVTFTTEKGPNAFKKTEVYEDSLQTEKREVFKGDAI